MSVHPLISFVIFIDLCTVFLVALVAFTGGFARFNMVTRLGVIFATVGVLVQALSSLHFLVFGSVSILAPLWALKDLGIFLVILGQAHYMFWKNRNANF